MRDLIDRLIDDSWIERVFLAGWRPFFWSFFAVFVVYAQALFFNFTYFDDQALILENAAYLKNAANLFSAFVQDAFRLVHTSDAYYRPLLTVSLMLDANLGGVAPFIYHFSNVLFHLAAVWLLFVFFIQLGFRRDHSFFFSLLFAVHPLLTQAVVWIPGRNDSLLAIGTLASFICLLRFLERRSWPAYLGHLFFFAFALFSKESALVIPLLALGLVYARQKEALSFRLAGWLIVSWSPILAVWFFLRNIALVNPLQLTWLDVVQSLSLNFLAVIQLIGKVLFPFNLSVLPTMRDTTPIFGVMALVILAALLIPASNRPAYKWWGLAAFALFLFPSLIGPNGVTTAGFLEHRMYLPLIGLMVALLESDAVSRLRVSRVTALSLAAVLLLLFSALTYSHSLNFRDRLTFWESAALTSPHSALAHRNLGAMYQLDGADDKAEQEYLAAIKINRNEPMVHNNLGLIYMNHKRIAEAEILFRQELAVNPNYDNALFNLGLLYYQQGLIGNAEALWKRTLEINPDYNDAYRNLAILYYQARDFQTAGRYVRILQQRGLPVHPALLKTLDSY